MSLRWLSLNLSNNLRGVFGRASFGKHSLAFLGRSFLSLAVFISVLFLAKNPTINNGLKREVILGSAVEQPLPVEETAQDEELYIDETLIEEPLINQILVSDISSRSVVIMDRDSGEIIFQKNAYLPYPPASLTKIVTSLIARKIYLLDSVLTVPAGCLNIVGNNTGFVEGELVKVEDLLHSLLLFSSSDAACVLAWYSGVDFVEEMNTYVINLGLTSTIFSNYIGLDAVGHVSSAYDTAILSKELLKDPFLSQIVNKPNYEFTSVSGQYHNFFNTNILLTKNLGVTGVKTGYTERAGGCLSLSLEREGQRLIIVILGSNDSNERFSDAEKLVSSFFPN